ncbi:unnamed protein product [Amoebophrya sp. A25]|nr:unnamed protein product [Amoebophrya sp. A25]|eukprot:GSA25T00007598001.1
MPLDVQQQALAAVPLAKNYLKNAAKDNQEFFLDQGLKYVRESFNNYHKAYKHNLRVSVLTEDQGDAAGGGGPPFLARTNLVDEEGEFNKNFICPERPGHAVPPKTWVVTDDLDKQPLLEFTRPVDALHAHFVDKTTGKVHWDAVYDFRDADDVAKSSTIADKAGGSTFNFLSDLVESALGGSAGGKTKLPNFSLKTNPFYTTYAQALKGGTQQDFLQICPPPDDPPHWYELTLTDVGPSPKQVARGGGTASLLGRIKLIETHPLDLPTQGIAHKEGSLLEAADPGMIMFAHS